MGIGAMRTEESGASDEGRIIKGMGLVCMWFCSFKRWSVLEIGFLRTFEMGLKTSISTCSSPVSLINFIESGYILNLRLCKYSESGSDIGSGSQSQPPPFLHLATSCTSSFICTNLITT
jgi:hypothetical protein